MLKGRKLLKINLLVSIILILGFIITSFLSYNANYRTSLSNVEQVVVPDGRKYILPAYYYVHTAC